MSQVLTPHALLDHAAVLKSGRPTFTAWIGMTDPMLPNILALEDFDSITIDMQHGMHDTRSVLTGISMAALAGKPAFVRIPVGDFTFASRALDFGAMGVIAPMINSVADAKAFASFTKYPPMGDRSWGPMRAIPLTGLTLNEYLKVANSHTTTLAMIETREALAALDDILAVPGIDGVFVGPSDLSIALNNGAKVDAVSPEMDKALDHVLARAKAHGKLATAFCITGEKAGELARRGYAMLTIFHDVGLIQAGARAELQKARGALKQVGKQSY